MFVRFSRMLRSSSSFIEWPKKWTPDRYHSNVRGSTDRPTDWAPFGCWPQSAWPLSAGSSLQLEVGMVERAKKRRMKKDRVHKVINCMYLTRDNNTFILHFCTFLPVVWRCGFWRSSGQDVDLVCFSVYRGWNRAVDEWFRLLDLIPGFNQFIWANNSYDWPKIRVSLRSVR